jgi:hypothetical protein
MKMLRPYNLVADLFVGTCWNDYSEIAIIASTNDEPFDHNNGRQTDTWREVPVKLIALCFFLDWLM